jgi:hypothetical protein
MGLRLWRYGIAAKILLIVAIPVLGVAVLAGFGIARDARYLRDCNNSKDLVTVSVAAADLVRELQQERVFAVLSLLHAGTASAEAFRRQTALTDVAIRHLQTTVADRLSLLRQADQHITELPGARDEVLSDRQISLPQIIDTYQEIIGSLLALRRSTIPPASVRPSRDFEAAGTVTDASEAVGQLQIAILRDAAVGTMTAESLAYIMAKRERFAVAVETFWSTGKSHWLASWNRALTDPRLRAARQLLDEITPGLVEKLLTLGADEWRTATDAWISDLHRLQADITSEGQKELAAVADWTTWRLLMQGIAMLVAIVTSMALAGMVTRRITSRLRILKDRLATGASQLLTENLREPAGESDAPQLRRPVELLPPGNLTGDDDEITELTRCAFTLYRNATLIAGREVERINTMGLLAHLSIRSQDLIDALLATVDQAEQNEIDSDRLRRMFDLDHLATRVARINRSVLVLGGALDSRSRPGFFALSAVILAAAAQVDQYTRVRVGAIDDRIEVRGEAVDDIAHIIAELIDGAIMRSPSDSAIVVSGYAVARRAMIHIHGSETGIEPGETDAINAQLSGNGSFMENDTQHLGFMIVRRLAERHGVRVKVATSDTGRFVAKVLLPRRVLDGIQTNPRVPSFQ